MPDPNIGVDSRSQYDLIRGMPGGVPALTAAIAQLHANGVKVMLPYNPWDTSTARENATDAVAMARLAREVGADGFNGDTMAFVSESFFEGEGRGLAIEPEAMGMPQMRSWHTLGWAYWTIRNDTDVPRVDFLKYALDSRWPAWAAHRPGCR